MRWFDIVTDVLTIISIAVAAIALLQNNRITRRQWNVDVYTLYSQRYADIIHDFPDDAFANRFDAEKLPAPSKALNKSIYQYMALVSETYYLYRLGYLDQSVWDIWEVEIKRTLKSPLMMQYWIDIQTDFAVHPEFFDYVKEQQSERSKS
ncbi:MAG: hypothetical protein AAFX95_23955 [Cyanobacteria bacterium J06639_16]